MVKVIDEHIVVSRGWMVAIKTIVVIVGLYIVLVAVFFVSTLQPFSRDSGGASFTPLSPPPGVSVPCGATGCYPPGMPPPAPK